MPRPSAAKWSITLLVLLGLAQHLVARHSGANELILAITGTVGPLERKVILSALNAQDPSIIASLSDDGHLVKVRTTAVLDLDLLQVELAPHGLTVHLIMGHGKQGGTVRSGLDDPPSAIININDPPRSPGDHEEEKAAWKQKHPAVAPPRAGRPEDATPAQP